MILFLQVHIGPTVSKKRVKDIVEIVNGLNVDSIAIVGDLVDGFLVSIKEKAMPLKDLRSKYGVFYATGNHECEF
jgi:predicted MPP superfamily phosphohydrolase